ncbi:MAG: hypothetical protein LH613_19120 [Chamaesiphon sp.]|nr:hypothetical protein [Chamaesiphon sp.]
MFLPIDLNTVAGLTDRDALVGVAFPLENRLKQEGYNELPLIKTSLNLSIG